MTMLEKRIEQFKNLHAVENTYNEQEYIATIYLLLNEVQWLKDEVARLKSDRYDWSSTKR